MPCFIGANVSSEQYTYIRVATDLRFRRMHFSLLSSQGRSSWAATLMAWQQGSTTEDEYTFFTTVETQRQHHSSLEKTHHISRMEQSQPLLFETCVVA